MTPLQSKLSSRIATSYAKIYKTPNYHSSLPSSVTPVIGIYVNLEKLKVKIGHTASVSAAVLPLHATNTKITWKNMHPHIASMKVQGNTATVTGKQAGQAVLIATTADNGFRDLCIVHVQPYMTKRD